MSDTILRELRALAQGVQSVAGRVDEVIAFVQKPKPEWERLAVAMKTRRKSREMLIAAAEAGILRSRRELGHGGKMAWLFSREDLDRAFPTQQ
jgi:hypothetical protein